MKNMIYSNVYNIVNNYVINKRIIDVYFEEADRRGKWIIFYETLLIQELSRFSVCWWTIQAIVQTILYVLFEWKVIIQYYKKPLSCDQDGLLPGCSRPYGHHQAMQEGNGRRKCIIHVYECLKWMPIPYSYLHYLSMPENSYRQKQVVIGIK